MTEWEISSYKKLMLWVKPVLWQHLLGPISLTIFHQNRNFLKISFYSYTKSYKVCIRGMDKGMLRYVDKECSCDKTKLPSALQWRHNGCDGVSNHQPHRCLLNRLFRRRSKKTSKLRVTGLCAGNSPVTGEFPAQMASNAENVSIWWRHHGFELWRNNP